MAQPVLAVVTGENLSGFVAMSQARLNQLLLAVLTLAWAVEANVAQIWKLQLSPVLLGEPYLYAAVPLGGGPERTL